MTINRRTLVDHYGSPLRMQVVEGQDGGKLVVEGKIGHVDKATANNRMYPRAVMEREIQRLQPRIEQGSVIGAVDHPGDGKSRIRDAGCIVRGLWVERSGEIKGRFEVVEESDAGRNLGAFLRRGAAIGMSSRGVGSTVAGPQGYDVVGEDFRLATWDFVADPACHDAYPGIISEDVDGEGNSTGKIVVDKTQVSENVLRTEFPDLVRAIEERALQVGSETCATDTEERLRETLEKEVTDGVSASSAEIRESIKLEIHEEVRKELEEDFAVKLVRALAELRASVSEEVRSEFDSDPENAQAKVVLRRMAEMVSPFTPDVDTAALLSEKDQEIAALRGSIDETHEKLERSQTEQARLDAKGKELAYCVFIEREISGRPDAAHLREMIGDPSSFTSAQELSEKVASALTAADKMQESAVGTAGKRFNEDRQALELRLEQVERERDRAKRDAARLRTSTEQQVARIEEQLNTVLAEQTGRLDRREQQLTEQREQLGETAAMGLKGALVGYAAKRTLGHKEQRSIIECVERGELASKEAIDARVRGLEENAQEAGGLSERMRRAFSRGREHPVDEDRVQAEPVGYDEADEDLAFLGTSLTEQTDLAGRIQSRNRR